MASRLEQGLVWGLWLQGSGCLWARDCALHVDEARSWGLWWAGPCPRSSVGLGGGGSLKQPVWWVGLVPAQLVVEPEDTCHGAHRLLDRGRAES